MLDALINVPLHKEGSEETKEEESVRWFSMPYHPAMQGVKLNHAIRGFCLDPAWGRVLKAG